MESPLPSPTPARASLDARAIFTMSLLCLLWSLQQISLKLVAAEASPMSMVGLRSAIALGLLVVLMGLRGDRPSPTRWKAGATVGLLFGVEFLLVSAALGLTLASHVVVFLYTAPIFAALGLQWRLPQERLAQVQWIGIGLAFCGIALAFLGGAGRGSNPEATRALLGDAIALAGGAAWGATTVTVRASALSSAPATETLFYQLLGAAVLILPFACLSGQWRFEPTARVWSHLLFQGAVVSFASFLTWFWLLRHYLASPLGVLSFLTPIFGVLLSAWLLHETLESRFLAGSALVLVGIGLVSGHAAFAGRARRRRAAAMSG